MISRHRAMDLSSIVKCVFLHLVLVFPEVRAACNVPSDLSGSTWLRPTDNAGLTFTANSADFGITYNDDPLTFTCAINDGNDYIFKSNTYETSLNTKIFYFCWRLVRVTGSAYMLYELSSPNPSASYQTARGHDIIVGDSVTKAGVCDIDPNTVFWTTMIKSGATAADVKAPCPALLQADFTYDKCGGSSLLAFCPDGDTGRADYTLCNTQILQSTGGIVYCMGSVERSSSTYVNLFDPDKGKATVCFKVESGGGNVNGDYYSGDCTTSVAGSLVLTSTETCVLVFPEVRAACNVPSDLSGSTWLRPTDNAGLTFTANSADFGITYNDDPLTFTCAINDGNDYIFKSNTYETSLNTKSFYFCWRLVRVTGSAYMLYELSSPNPSASYQTARGHDIIVGDSVTKAGVCDIDPNTVFWTTMIKSGATAADVKAPCPALLQADFTYDKCGGSSLLAFCPDGDTGRADYTLCNTQILQSSGGIVYCMGSVERSSSTYVNLFDPDKGKATVCFKVESGGGNVNGDYYSGDCTTSVAGSLVLTSTETCASDDPGGSNVGLFAGAAIGGLLLIALIAFLLYWFIIKKRAGAANVGDKDAQPNNNDPESKPETKPDTPHTLENGTTPSSDVANGTANGDVTGDADLGYTALTYFNSL